MTGIRVALFTEDINLRDFLVPAVEKLARQSGLVVEWADVDLVHGCRAKKLKELVAGVRSNVQVIVVGADVDGRHHASRKGHRRKARKLKDLVADERLIVAAADPCVEAWLCTHPVSFATALEQVLSVRFVSAANWPRPGTERQAKEQLGRLVHDGLAGEKLVRNGFEYASEIVELMPLDKTNSTSLTDWAHEFRRALAGVR